MNIIQQLRYVGLIEGVSSVLLFFVAVPLKYFNDMPEAVTLVGRIHGGLFILYAYATFRAYSQLKRPVGWGLKIFLAAIFPFGPFLIEPRLRREQAELEAVVTESS